MRLGDRGYQDGGIHGGSLCSGQECPVDLSCVFKAGGQDLGRIAVKGDHLCQRRDHIIRIDPQIFHAVKIGGDIVCACLHSQEALLFAVYYSTGDGDALCFHGLHGLQAFQGNRNFYKDIGIYFFHDSVRVPDHAFGVRSGHLDVKRAVHTDDGTDLSHVREEVHISFPFYDGRIGSYSGNGENLAAAADVVKVGSV